MSNNYCNSNSYYPRFIMEVERTQINNNKMYMMAKKRIVLLFK